MSASGVIPPSMRADVGAIGAVSDTPERQAERYAVAAWSAIVEPGDGIAGAVVAELGAVRALRLLQTGEGVASARSVVGASALDAARARWRPRANERTVEHAVRTAARAGVRLVTPSDVEWPVPFADLGVHAPLGLWVRGDVRRLAHSRGAVAIVGARASTAYGDVIARELAGALAADGVAVVSGAAFGIDAAVHRGALAAAGTTTAFLAGGVERASPAAHADMIDEITRIGVVASEVACGTTPTPRWFLQRNRLIAAHAAVTVVVEAGARSGSLNTAAHAASLGRALGAVPGPITSPASAGCHRLLREFAATCVTGPDDVRELLGTPTSADDTGTEVSAVSTRIVQALSRRSPRSVEDVAARSGVPVDDVRAALGILALEGAAVRDERGWRFVPPSVDG